MLLLNPIIGAIPKMIVPNENSHVAIWLKEYFEEMVVSNLSEDCLSLLNHVDLGIEEQMVGFLQDVLNGSDRVIDGDQERLLVEYKDSFFSIHIVKSFGRSGDALEFEIKRFNTLVEAREDYNII